MRTPTPAPPTSVVVTYLTDHFAGPMFAVAEANVVRDHLRDEALTPFLERFIGDLREEREVLRQIIDTLGGSPSLVKAAGGWLAEKAVRLKLTPFTTLSLFESLETLRLGAQGKRGLWSYLLQLAECDPRLQLFDLPRLVRQADVQIAALESFRQEAGLALAREDGLVPITFVPATEPSERELS